MSEQPDAHVLITQSVAILVDGNNIERSIHELVRDKQTMINFDTLIPRLLDNRGLNRLVYFREGKQISEKLSERLHTKYHGSVRPCHKSADIPLTIKATQLSSKVDTIIIMSGDSDYIELVRHLKGEGVRVEIAAVRQTTSQLLIDESDYFHEIKEEDWFTLPAKKGGKKSDKKRKKK
ncbi:NYN domain-containing protein [Kaarinaea lacus]